MVPISTKLAWGLALLPFRATFAIRLAASVALRPYAHTVSDLYPFSSLIAYSNDDADKFVAEATWIQGLTLAMPKVAYQFPILLENQAELVQRGNKRTAI